MAGGTKIGDAFIEIGAKTAGLDSKMKGVKGALGGLKSMALKAGVAIAGVFAVRAGARAISGMIGQAEVARKNYASLAAVIKATGGAAGISAAQMKKMSSELGDQIAVGPAVIQSTQGILATFKNIKGSTFKEATEAAYDMAAVLGQDARQGAIQLGKALNDPVQGMTAMRRVGVSFSAEQIKQVKNLQEQGRLTEAQAIILAELKSEFGGAAAAMVTPIAKARYEWDEMKETMGRALLDLFSIDGAAGGLADKFHDIRMKIEKMVETGVIVVWSEKIMAIAKLIWHHLKRPFVLTKAFLEGEFRETFIRLEKERAQITIDQAERTNRRLQAKRDANLAASKKATAGAIASEEDIQEEIEATAAVEAATVETIIKGEKKVMEAKQRSMGTFQSFADIMRKAQQASVATETRIGGAWENRAAPLVTGSAEQKQMVDKGFEGSDQWRKQEEKKANILRQKMTEVLERIEGKLPSPVFS